MLYIEDFLELIEPFPQEIRERLTEMRETDLQIQNDTDKLDERIKSFFQQCKKQKTDWKNQNYDDIRGEYKKLLENAEDKVQITNQLYELIEKYLKKLDQELQKFKLELEADHAGITSKLEEVINNSTINNELTSPTIGANAGGYMMSGSSYNFSEQTSDFTLNNSATNELMKMMAHNTNSLESNIYKSASASNQKRKNLDKTRQEDDESNSSWNSKLDNSYISSSNKNPTFHFSDSNKKSSLASSVNKKNLKLGQSSNSASLNKIIRSNKTISQIQARLADQKQKTPAGMKQQQPGKTLKSEKSQRIKKTKLIDLDYDDESKYDYFEQDNKHESMLDPDLYTDDLNEATSETTGTSENDLAQLGRLMNNEDEFETDSSGDEMDPSNLDNEDTMNSDADQRLKHKRQQQLNRFKEDWNSGEDTNERYCICKDISYGDMIMCDNARCETQWFHFVCVGLNAAPKGKWFCPFCVDSKKKKKEKQLNMILSSTNLASPSPLSSVNKQTNSATDFLQSSQATSASPFLSASSSFTTSFK